MKRKVHVLLLIAMGLWLGACESDGSSKASESKDSDSTEQSTEDAQTDSPDSHATDEQTDDTLADTGKEKDTGKDTESAEEPDDTGEDTVPEEPKPLAPLPLCTKTCTGAEDCPDVGADKLHRAGNYACDDGFCRYTGCVNDANCADEFPAQGYVCSESGECLYPCEGVADCVLGGMDADEDNWQCDKGGCVYLGCQNSYECLMTYGNEFVCADVLHKGIASCTQSCTNAEECVWTTDAADLAFDANNYQCIRQSASELRDSCDYLGCAGDEECKEGYRCKTPDAGR